MKRNVLSALSLLLAFTIIALCFSGCTFKNNGSATSAFTEEDGVARGTLENGKYELKGFHKEGTDSEKALASLKKLEEKGMNLDLIVEGKDITLMEVKYTLKGKKFVNEESAMFYAVNGTKVTVLDSQNNKLVFEKR